MKEDQVLTARHVCAGAVATVMTLTMAAMPMAAFADNAPSAGAQTGSGLTDVTVQFAVSGEHGGTSEPEVIPAPAGTDPEDRVDENGNPDPDGEYIKNPLYNPDEDHDNVGDNIAFTVPSAINFVANAKGELTGPSETEAYIENQSVFPIHASSFKVAAEEGWTLIKNGTEASADNSADFQFGPASDMLDAYDYTTKSAVTKPTAWNMAADASSGTTDRVQMKSEGNLFKINLDLTTQTKIATITTYVSPGIAS